MKALFQAVLWVLIVLTSASKTPTVPNQWQGHTAIYWQNPLAVTNPNLLAYYIAVSKPPYADPQPGDVFWCKLNPWVCGGNPYPPQVWE